MSDWQWCQFNVYDEIFRSHRRANKFMHDIHWNLQSLHVCVFAYLMNCIILWVEVGECICVFSIRNFDISVYVARCLSFTKNDVSFNLCSFSGGCMCILSIEAIAAKWIHIMLTLQLFQLHHASENSFQSIHRTYFYVNDTTIMLIFHRNVHTRQPKTTPTLTLTLNPKIRIILLWQFS